MWSVEKYSPIDKSCKHVTNTCSLPLSYTWIMRSPGLYVCNSHIIMLCHVHMQNTCWCMLMLYTLRPFSLSLSVRVYDLFLFLLSFIFLAYLMLMLFPTVKKLHGSVPLFRLLYCMVSLCLPSCVTHTQSFFGNSCFCSRSRVFSQIPFSLILGTMLMRNLCTFCKCHIDNIMLGIYCLILVLVYLMNDRCGNCSLLAFQGFI